MYLPKIYTISEKARIEFSYRTIVLQSMKRLLKLEKDYKIVRIQEGGRTLMNRSKKEVP